MKHPANKSTVLIVGPSPSMLGGMASVVGQHLSLRFNGRYRTVLFPITLSQNGERGLVGNVLRHVRHIVWLGITLARVQPQIVHIHTCSGFSFFRNLMDLLVVRLAGRQVVWHIHGAAFDDFFDRSSVRQQRLIRWGLEQADRIVVLSQSWKGRIAMMAPDADIAVIENAVELPTLPEAATQTDIVRFVLLARMDVWKGIDDLLAACRLLNQKCIPFQVSLAGPEGSCGDGPELQRKIDALGLTEKVRYIGPVRGEAKRGLLEEADVYIQPSHHEGMPISLLEALAAGLPVVATRVGAVPEVLQDGIQGLLCEPRRPESLAGAMHHVIGDGEARRAMGRSARALAISRFSLRRFERDLMDLYDVLAGQREAQALSPSWDVRQLV